MAGTEEKPIASCILVEQVTFERILARLDALERPPARPPAAAAAPATPVGKEHFAIRIVSSSVTTTGPEYLVVRMMGGNTADTHTGLVQAGVQQYRARNTADDAEAGSPLPDGTVIANAFWSPRDKESLVLFSYGGGGASLPEGEHQYMVAQMTSDNVLGFDFVRAHPLL